MRIGGFFSLIAHGALVATGMLVAPSVASDAEMMPVFDVDIVSISDETNLAAITRDAELDEKAEEAQQEEVATAATPPPKEEETVALDEPEAKPPPPKPREKTFEEELAALTGAIPKTKPQPQRSSDSSKSTNLGNIPDAGSRPSYGKGTGNSATMAAIITRQLITNRCWTDHSDMADAHRLQTVIKVRFGRNGRFLEEPKMIEPSRPPTNDPPLQVYIQHAFTALNKCNTIGFVIPPDYFNLPTNEQYLELQLLPNIAKMR